MKILITGDSFAADWTIKYPNICGWPNMLAKEYSVTNVAQAGVSEYKIWKQIKCQNLQNFDIVIVSHTSPSRVHTFHHPIHSKDKLHYNADLMLNDIIYHKSKLKNFFNKSLHTAYFWFLYHYDEEFHQDVYNLFYDDIYKMLKDIKNISIANFDVSSGATLNYSRYLTSNKGIANHFDNKINTKIYQDIKKCIQSL